MRKILLARPNDFLVNAVRTLAQEADFEPVALHSLGQFPSIDSGALAGAVISTAVTSSVSESVGQVFTAVRSKYRDEARATAIQALKRHFQ